jgi:hypothetical protein
MHAIVLVVAVIALAGTRCRLLHAQSAAVSRTSVTLGGTEYLHRWSKAGQHEFTPRGDEDLAHWRDMVTINVHDAVADGEQLADLANRVVGNYQSHGKILRTDSRPRTAQRPAEHLVQVLRHRCRKGHGRLA